MKSKSIIFITVTVVILVFILFMVFHRSPPTQTQYISAEVSRGHIKEVINATGMIKPSTIVDVGAQVSGEISKLTVEIGDKVKTGDLIAEIDARTKQNAKDTAVAQLASYQADLATAQSALDKVKKIYNRAKKLHVSGAVSQEDFDTATADFIAAQNTVKVAQANIIQSELTIQDAEVDLGYTTVTAPITGDVIAVPVEEGQTVNASLSTPTLVVLAKTDMMKIKTEIAEADVLSVKAGMKVSFKLLGKNTDEFEGTLKSIDPAPKEISDDDDDLTSSTAIYYYADIDVPNPNGIFKYGMTSMVSIVVNEVDDVLIIPLTAISENTAGKSQVKLIMPDGKITDQVVVTGIDDGVNIEIKNGLKVGDKVVISDISGASSSADHSFGPF